MTYIVQCKRTQLYIATKIEFKDGDHCWTMVGVASDAHHFKDRASGKDAIREFKKPNSISSLMRENPKDYTFIKVNEERVAGGVHIRTCSGHVMPLHEFQKIPGNTAVTKNRNVR